MNIYYGGSQMKKWLKHEVSNEFTLALARLNWKMRRFFGIIGIIAMLGGLLPQNQVVRAQIINPPLSTSESNGDDYDGNLYKSLDIDVSKVPIAFEDASLRTENEKIFRKVDGTYEIAIYNEAVHYEENGSWKDIDNSLSFDFESDCYLNKANKFTIKFPKTLDDNKQIKLSMGNYSIDWKMLNIDRTNISYDDSEKLSTNLKELTNVNQSIIYTSAQSNVDLEYILSGTSVKENIILNAYSSDAFFSFEYKTKGLSIQKNIDGNIVFIEDDGSEVFSFASLYMMDNNGNSSTNLSFDLIQTGNNTYTITITPDDAWLKNANYPVTIDPSLISSSTSMSIFDTYISELEYDTNFSSSPIMYVSNVSSTSEYRGLLYFYIPSALMNKTITYAHMQFTKNTMVTGKQINLYKNTETFASNTATWDNAPEFESSVIDYYIVNSQTPMLFDITEAVKEWQATGTSMTSGFTITQDGWYGDLMSVYQRHISSPNADPVITIGYQEPAGLKNYWTYTSQEMGRVGAGYISDYTGNITWVRNEYNLDHEYLPMTLSFYHDNYTRSIDLGYGDGWRTNYNIQVLVDSTSGQYYLHEPDGSKVYFVNETSELVGGDIYKYTSIAEDGSRMTLERVTEQGETTEMSIITVDEIEYKLNGSGRLTSVYSQKTQQNLWVYYIDSTSQKIDYIKDEADNRIDFTYNAENTQLTITELQLKQSDSSLRGVEKRYYYYDAYNNIDYIQCYYRYGTGTETQWSSGSLYDMLEYYFDSSNRLVYAFDHNNVYKVQYYYDTKNRVYNYVVTDSGSNIGNTSISYQSSRTIYTDYEGDSIYYTFDNYGHTINLMDDYGNTTYYRYSGLFSYNFDTWNPETGYDIVNVPPNYYNNNNLIESSDVMKQQQNPLNNHGFEESYTAWTLYQGTDGNIAYSTGEHVLGDYSLKVTKNTSEVYAYQSVYLKADEYTISGWIKNDGSSEGAYIDVIGETSCGTIMKVYGNDEWTYYSLSFTLSSNTTITVKLINESVSSAYFDNIQITEGFVESRYNAVNNNSFEEGTTSWTMSGASVITIYETDIMEEILGEKALTIYGNGTTSKYFYQTITNLVTVGETYVVGGWAKADAVPNKAYWYNTEVDDDRFFGLYVSVYCVPGNMPNYTKIFYLPFNSNIDTWQYQMQTFTVPEFAVNVKVHGEYQGEGTAYFDNIQLYHDKISTSYGYDTDTGNLMTIEEPNGSTTNMSYDETNHINAVDKDGKVTNIERTGTYQIEEVSMNNVRTTLEYNSSTKQLISTYIGYDKDASTQDKWFKTSTYYTTDGQYISAVKDEFGNVITTDINESVGLIDTIIDAIGNTQDYFYDEYGNLVSTTKTDSETSNTMNAAYEYDIYGHLEYIHRDGYTYKFEYNGYDQVTAVKIANTTVMSYDYWEETVGSTTYYTDLLQQQTYGNGDYVSFTYNDENQIKTVSFNGSLRFEYEYDSSGRLSIYKDMYNTNIYFYSYDLAGRIRAITDIDGNEILYTYDDSGNINRYEYTIGTVSRGIEYHYNSITGEYEYATYDIGSSEITKTYNYATDSLKRLNNIELTFGSITLTKIMNYDDGKVDPTMGNATTRIHSIAYANNGITQANYIYIYDDNSNITGITVKNQYNQVVDDYDYYYDGFNQLVRENVYINSGGFSRTYLYSYDDQGNISQITEHVYTISDPVITTPIAYTVYEYNNTWGDQLSKITEYTNFVKTKEISYTYDANGNPTGITNLMNSNLSKTLNWDGRQLNSLSYYCGGMSFKYNDQGIRTYKSIGGCSGGYSISYVLDGSKILSETKGTSTIYYTYDADGTLISMNYNGNEYFYITNLQGDIIELVDISGTTVVKYKYDAWGNIIYQYDSGLGIANANPFRYRSYYFDIETGWYYLQSRYYDPSIGRFISSDGLVGKMGDVQSLNMYAYCANNPVMHIDPIGEAATLIALLASTGPIGWFAIAIIAIVIVYYYSTEILDFVDTAAGTVTSAFEKTLSKDYTVYSLIDEEGTIKYVGRVKTANYNARIAYHEKTKPGLVAGPKVDNLNYWECRGIEQLGIIGNSAGWFDKKTNPSGNKINGISNINPNRFDYYGAGIRYILNNLENEWINLFH